MSGETNLKQKSDTIVWPLVRLQLSKKKVPMALVTNYGEGGATKLETRGSETVCASPLKTG